MDRMLWSRGIDLGSHTWRRSRRRRRCRRANIEAIRAILEAAGIEFLNGEA
jgi:hypothetical protein